MDRLTILLDYYKENAAQARQHENQRERMTTIMLSLAVLLVGIITYSELSLWSLSASITLTALGIFGFLFSAKLYERSKMHHEILKAIRIEIDNGDQSIRPLRELREDAENAHIKTFKWRLAIYPKQNYRGANSSIAKLRLHFFWELVNLIIFLIGVLFTIVILFQH